MFRWVVTAQRKRQRARSEQEAQRLGLAVLSLERQLSERDAVIRVLRVELEQLAAVCARDRLRVESETATLARRKAVMEGVLDDGPSEPRVF